MVEILQRLPQFTVTAVRPAGATGVFASSLRLEGGWHAYLVDDHRRCIRGRFLAFDLPTRRGVFLPDEHQAHRLVENKTYSYLDGYWGERVSLVLDLQSCWQRKRFEPRSNWDHEHCSICWAKIMGPSHTIGYVNQEDLWLCEECYTEYLEPRDISLIDDNALSQIIGTSDA
jgi:hypothetical protein